MAIRSEIVLSAKDRTKGAFKSVNRSLSGLSSSVFSLQGRIGALVGVGGFGALVKSSIDLDDSTGKVSEKLGLTTEALSKLQFAVGQTSEVTRDQFNVALQRMVRRLEDAADKGGPVADQLEKIGLNAKELNALSPDDAFLRIADAMERTADEGLKVKTAFSLFDTEGVNLVNTLQNGSDALNELGGEAEKLGVVISENSAKRAAEFNDNIDALTKSAVGFGLSISEDVTPALITVTEVLREAAASGDLFASIGERIGESLFNAFGPKQSEDIEKTKLEIESLTTKLRDIQGKRDAALAGWFGFKSNEDIDAQAAEISTKILALRQKLAGETAFANQPAAGGAGGDPKDKPNVFAGGKTSDEIESDALEMILWHQQVADDFKRLELERVQQVEQVEAQITSMRQNTANMAIGLLQVLGGKSKQAAIAAVALNKGLAIAQAVQNTSVAVTKALTVDPTGALASRVALLGKVQVGLIAATGLAQVGNINAGGTGGGGGLSATGTPIGAAEALPQGQLGGGQNVNITLSGDNFSGQGVRDLIDEINEAVSDGARINVEAIG